MDNNKTQDTLPEGWIWTTIDEIGIVTSGGTPSTKNPSFWNGKIPWITPADLSSYKNVYIEKGSRNISEIGMEYSSAKLLPKGSILFSSRAPIGYVVIAKNDLATNQGFKNIVATKSLYSEYVYYYLKTIKPLAEKMASGTTFLELSASKFAQIPIPLPPLEEQHRIVSRIEELFSELDHAEEALKKAQKQLEIYKQALLKSAFEGSSREKREIIVGQLGIISTGTTPSKSSANFYGTDYNFYKPSDLNKGYHVINSSDKLSELGFYSARVVPDNSILVTCIGATIGKTGIARKGGAFNQQINAIIPNENYLPEFIYYQIISLKFQKEMRQNASSTTLPIINKGKFVQLSFLSFSKKDQVEIVQELDSKFTIIENLERSIINGILKVEMFRNIILNKAFKGKLVLQNNDEEPASILLDRIQAEKALYVSSQKIKQKEKLKAIKPMETNKKELRKILEKSLEPIPSEILWQESIYFENIETFYAELKKIEHEIEVIINGKESSITLKR